MPGSTFIYYNNIPDGPNRPSDDWRLMKTNTNSTDSIIDVDHYSFESASQLDGWHRKSTYPSFATVPAVGPATDPGQGAVYTKETPAASGEIQLFYRRENNGAEIQLTSGIGVAGAATILSGTILVNGNTLGTANTITTAIPANAYGQVFIFNTSQTAVQMATFATPPSPATRLFVINLTGTSASAPFTLTPLTLVGSTSAIELKVFTSSTIGLTYNWRVHYWLVS